MVVSRGVAWSLPFLFVVSVAFADVAPDDPCEGAAEGDACESTDGAEGTCTNEEGALVCDTGDDGGCTITAPGTGADDPVVIAGLLVLGAAWCRRRR